MKKTAIHLFVIIFLIAVCVLFLYGKSYFSRNEIEILTDTAYVQSTFPDIDIENARYYYKQLSGNREIGLVRADYCGIMELDERFSEKLKKEYKWKAAEVDNATADNLTLLGESNYSDTWLYSDEFCNDGKYISHSKLGDFYFDAAHNKIYFKVEFS